MVDTVTWRLKNWYINFPGGFLGGHRMIELGGGSYFLQGKLLISRCRFFFVKFSRGPPWAPWARADGPRPMGQGRWASRTRASRTRASRTPPWGYISGPEADGAPWAPWASGTPPWGYHLVSTPPPTPPSMVLFWAYFL